MANVPVEGLSSKDLRMLPINYVIRQNYNFIVSYATEGNLFVEVCFGYDLHRRSPHLATEQNINFVREELIKLLPGVKFTNKGTTKTVRFNGGTFTYDIWTASWEEYEEEESVIRVNDVKEKKMKKC